MTLAEMDSLIERRLAIHPAMGIRLHGEANIVIGLGDASLTALTKQLPPEDQPKTWVAGGCIYLFVPDCVDFLKKVVRFKPERFGIEAAP